MTPRKPKPPKRRPRREPHATVDGTEVHFEMKFLDDKGTVVATPRDHTFVVAKVEPEIATDLKAKGHSVGKIDCHGDVWVAVKGAKVTCDVTDEAGAECLWSAEFTDEHGTHSHSIAPKSSVACRRRR